MTHHMNRYLPIFFILDFRRGIIRARRTPHLTFKLLLGRT